MKQTDKTEEKGVVVRRTKGFYYLRIPNGNEIECKVKGALFKDSLFDNQIAVGDEVFYKKKVGEEVGLITTIQNRRSFLSRNRVGIDTEQILAANIDNLLIVTSAKNPPFRANLVNRMLVAAAIGNITPCLVITKTDLVNDDTARQLVQAYKNLDLKIIFFSTKDKDYDPFLLELLTGSVSVLAGQSGVGKSSLLNRLFPSLSIKVGKISPKTLKGSHTTTYAVMHEIAKDSYVIDTPGIREFGLWNITQENIGQFYPVIEDFHGQCKHRNCKHVHEPQCAIKTAVNNKEIHNEIYNGYISIFNSLDKKNNMQKKPAGFSRKAK